MFKSRKIFYGWWIVLSGALIGSYIAGAFFYGFTAFVAPMTEEFGWSHFAFSLAASLRGIERGLLAPLMGFLVDRLGPRKLIFSGALVGGLGFILLSITDSLIMFYGACIVLSIGFSASGGLASITAVAHWFHRKVGRAMGLMTTGFGMGGLLLPVVIWLIHHHGWRATFLFLGIGTWVIIPLLALVVRHKPEQYGYLPDGDFIPVLENAGNPTSEIAFDARQALRTRTFWLLSLSFAICFMGVGAVVLHVMPYLRSVDLAPGSIVLVATLIPLLSIIGRLTFGWLGDVFPKRHVLSLTTGLQAIGLLAFYYAPALWALIIFLVTFGSGYGGAIALRPAIQREYFGRNAFGSIQGWSMAVMTIGSIIGPAFAGWVFDIRGSFQLAWLIFAIMTAVAIPLIMAIELPQNDRQSSSSP
ncbi:MAG: MFS transporter [Dehalococcoidia bacterium]|nr:Oxalate:formate antiporter [Chloroflexota bacterium]MBT9161206.1 Oxalate:formate antiporter [Chloroflexota bacterium]